MISHLYLFETGFEKESLNEDSCFCNKLLYTYLSVLFIFALRGQPHMFYIVHEGHNSSSMTYEVKNHSQLNYC